MATDTRTLTLKEFIEAASTKIEQVFDRTGVLSQVFHFIDREGRDVIMTRPPGDKDTSADAARSILKIAGATRCLIMDEVWFLNAGKSGATKEDVEAEYEKLRKHGGSIANHPKRIEAVMLMAEDSKEGTLTAYRPIVRKINSRARLGPLEFMPTTGATDEGRLVGMLPRGKLSS